MKITINKGLTVPYLLPYDVDKYWAMVYELRDNGIEEEYDSIMNMYYEEGPDDLCEYMLMKYPGWLEKYPYGD